MARAVESEIVSAEFDRSLIEQFPILAIPDLRASIVDSSTTPNPGSP
jgi:hypothetical protein